MTAAPSPVGSTAPRRSERLMSAGLGIGAAGVLGVAAWLDPSPTGHSTHVQLGLRPCTFLAITGWPCPMCGATTTFALMADGRIRDGLFNQPFAAILFVGTIVLAVLGLLEAVFPRGRWRVASEMTISREGRIAAVLLGVMGAAWIWRIALQSGAIAP